ncbi:GAMMA-BUTYROBETAINE HYDROXYLASE-RELATED [Salix purpurea]|uniref:GAMMA-BUTYROBETAINE HYDROXYLASE-RELATED n=1 Tax=Salix purpurea TaxID=77065 RepID=A0A9Q0YVD0_SALPP|nr:GAMMA-BUTYROBETAINE HYDROXYLASE-RELATED [Salix purpurea]
MSSSFKEIQIQHQKHYSNITSFPFPSVLSPNPFLFLYSFLLHRFYYSPKTLLGLFASDQVPEFPSKLFFFCEVEPGSGGETPIVLSHVVYERMKERHPDFVEKLEEHGLIYTRVLGEEDDPSSPIGRGWKSTFLTNDKSVAAQRAAKLGMTLEWLEDGVKTIMGPIPAIKYDKSRNRKIWFNSMVAAYTGWKDARNDPIKAVKFGDGEPLPSDIIHDCLV